MDVADLYVSNQDTETHRFCSRCQKLKPLHEFYKDGKDGKGEVKYRRDCKECYKRQRIVSRKARKINNDY